MPREFLRCRSPDVCCLSSPKTEKSLTAHGGEERAAIWRRFMLLEPFHVLAVHFALTYAHRGSVPSHNQLAEVVTDR